MGKHEPMTAKAQAVRIKAKGLQPIKYYCEMCKKQCRDANGFKCHIASEAHNRQAAIVGEDPDKFVNEFSKQVMEGFMYILKTRYRSTKVLANTIFNEYIKDRDHIHLNGTRWTTLTELANWLGENGFVKVDQSERGVMVTYIDRDPETLRRKELEAKKALQAKEAAERNQKEIERQREATKLLLEKQTTKQLPNNPIPIIQIAVTDKKSTSSLPATEIASSDPSTSKECEDEHLNSQAEEVLEVVERPVFQVQSISLKPASTTGYKPPPPKRKVSGRSTQNKKKCKRAAS